MKEFFKFIENNSLKDLFIDAISKVIIAFTFITPVYFQGSIESIVTYMVAFYMVDYYSYYKYLNVCGKLSQ